MKKTSVAVPFVPCLLVAALCVGGCDGAKPPATKTSTSPPKTEDVAKVEPKIDASSVQTELVDFAGYTAAIAKHQGQVVVVDAWATWCKPCVKNFHHLVELHREFSERGVKAVSLNFDFLDDGEPQAALPKIREFLASQGATFDNLVATETLSDWGTPERLNVESIPAVLVYGRDGKLAQTFVPSAELLPEDMYRDVHALVADLLKGEAK